MDTDELVQVARMAVVKAVRRYRPAEGSGTVYAIPTVTGEKRWCGCHPISLDAATATGGASADEQDGARCPEGDIEARDAFGRAIRELTEKHQFVLRLRCTTVGRRLGGAALGA